MSRIISLPMYNFHEGDPQALIDALASMLKEGGGEDVEQVYHTPPNLYQHWTHPSILLSQTCGYPLCTSLPEVQVVGTFHYQAGGCEDYHYSSQLVVRKDDADKGLVDFRHRRVVCNSTDSQSGYHSLRDRVAKLPNEGRFFSETILSGSHRDSLAALQANEADIAAIDAVSWAMFKRHNPSLTQGLVSIGTTALTPGLPLITAASTTPYELQQLRLVLARLVNEPEWRSLCAAHLINGFTPTNREDYRLIDAMAQAATAAGVEAL